jgi:hypothetical protein
MRSLIVSEYASLGCERLHLYLNDHLAGSVAAIEMVDNLIEHHPADRFGKFFRDLRNEIQTDQEKLSDLIRKVGGKESDVRKAAAWLAEKFGRAKFGDTEDSVELLQATEGLALGITGKKLLWRSLAAAGAHFPELQGTDFGELEKRAQEQFTRVEDLRMELSREAFRAP